MLKDKSALTKNVFGSSSDIPIFSASPDEQKEEEVEVRNEPAFYVAGEPVFIGKLVIRQEIYPLQEALQDEEAVIIEEDVDIIFKDVWDSNPCCYGQIMTEHEHSEDCDHLPQNAVYDHSDDCPSLRGRTTDVAFYDDVQDDEPQAGGPGMSTEECIEIVNNHIKEALKGFIGKFNTEDTQEEITIGYRGPMEGYPRGVIPAKIITVEKLPKRDPVHEKDGKWHFWDETWGYSYGPFDTREDADEACAEYADYLNRPKEESSTD